MGSRHEPRMQRGSLHGSTSGSAMLARSRSRHTSSTGSGGGVQPSIVSKVFSSRSGAVASTGGNDLL